MVKPDKKLKVQFSITYFGKWVLAIWSKKVKIGTSVKVPQLNYKLELLTNQNGIHNGQYDQKGMEYVPHWPHGQDNHREKISNDPRDSDLKKMSYEVTFWRDIWGKLLHLRNKRHNTVFLVNSTFLWKKFWSLYIAFAVLLQHRSVVNVIHNS